MSFNINDNDKNNMKYDDEEAVQAKVYGVEDDIHDSLYDDIGPNEKLQHLSTTTTAYNDADVGEDGQQATISIGTTNKNYDSTTTETNLLDSNSKNAVLSYDFLLHENKYGTTNDNNSNSNSNTTSILPKNSIEQVIVLQQQLDKVQKENNILKRNIGILYRTAISEIQRKDQQIQELVLLQQQQQYSNNRR